MIYTSFTGSEHPFGQIVGLVPRGHGFHKRNIILQVSEFQFDGHLDFHFLLSLNGKIQMIDT
jgi:hypothetical protein